MANDKRSEDKIEVIDPDDSRYKDDDYFKIISLHINIINMKMVRPSIKHILMVARIRVVDVL